MRVPSAGQDAVRNSACPVEQESLGRLVINGIDRVVIASGQAGALSMEVLQALPVAVYTTDADGRITFFNEAAAARLPSDPMGAAFPSSRIRPR